MDFDLSKRYCYYFNETTKIPHGSYNEKELSDYVVEFAKKEGLEWKQDDMWNVIVYKPGSQGLENAAPLMLQAHMDMVPEKNKDSDHDFLKDPLKLAVTDGWLHATGTTLGADDCAGVAYMLAILEDKSLKHPPLECVFTVLEEVGLLGAMVITTDWIKSHRMISLDSGSETSTSISSAGGCRCDVSFPLVMEANTWPTYAIEIRGLMGGHSGGNINKERGNSNVLSMRALKEAMLSGVNARLVSYQGGLKENAIPREADIVFTSDTPLAEIEAAVAKTFADYKVEFEHSDPEVSLVVKKVDDVDTAATLESTQKCVNLVYLLPNGFRARSMAIEGLTLTSLNLGVTTTEDGVVKLCFSLRSAIDSGIDNLLRIIGTQAEMFGCTLNISSRYPGFNYKVDSDMRKTMAKVVNDIYGVELALRAGHGGTECGVFSALYPDFDIISMGPLHEDIHTPKEKLDLASFDRAYKLLTTVISECE